MTSSLIEFGFAKAKSDFFFLNLEEVFLDFCLVDVDDIILTGSCRSEVSIVKTFLRTKFLMKNTCILKYF